jgi:hypothetical protein
MSMLMIQRRFVQLHRCSVVTRVRLMLTYCAHAFALPAGQCMQIMLYGREVSLLRQAPYSERRVSLLFEVAACLIDSHVI